MKLQDYLDGPIRWWEIVGLIGIAALLVLLVS